MLLVLLYFVCFVCCFFLFFLFVFFLSFHNMSSQNICKYVKCKRLSFRVISAIIQQCDGSVQIISVVHHAFLISMLETSYPKSNYSRNVYLFCLFLVFLLVCFALAVCFCLFFVFVFVYLPLFSFFL